MDYGGTEEDMEEEDMEVQEEAVDSP